MNQEKRKVAYTAYNVLKEYLMEEKKRGTIVINSYGHSCKPYTGLLSLTEYDCVKIQYQQKGDTGVTLPVSRRVGPNNDQEIAYIESIFDDNKKLIYERKK